MDVFCRTVRVTTNSSPRRDVNGNIAYIPPRVHVESKGPNVQPDKRFAAVQRLMK